MIKCQYLLLYIHILIHVVLICRIRMFIYHFKFSIGLRPFLIKYGWRMEILPPVLSASLFSFPSSFLSLIFPRFSPQSLPAHLQAISLLCTYS